MKKNYLLILIIFYAVLSVQAQSKYAIFLNSGYTYNESLELNGEEVKNSLGYVFTLGLTYKAITYKSIYAEIGLAGKTIFSSGKVDGRFYNARTFRVAMPVKFVFPIADKWEVSSGVVVQNNVDFSEFDLRLRDKYSWRINFLAEAKYRLNSRWYLTAGLRLNMRKIPDAYFVNDPKKAILIGIGKRINNRKTEKIKL
ncbi:MAG: outer membrane receptor protein involved in Fe transport [Saprospiraceae bacterium]|jgi:outer membrane receptor protein involved in Fe transport